MLDHIDLAVRDLAVSRAFFVAALSPLGVEPITETDREDGRRGTGFGRGKPGLRPHDAAGKLELTWLESAVLRKTDGAWRIHFLHSTRAAPE